MPKSSSDMPDDNLPIVPNAGSGLAQTGPQGGRIVTEMVNGALALRRNNAALVPRCSIGEHVFCEPDYRQIILWADALRMQPETVLETILREPNRAKKTKVTTSIKGGRLTELYWDLDTLPLKSFEWVNGLVIESLSIFSRPGGGENDPICSSIAEYFNPSPLERILSLPLPYLQRLDCGQMNGFVVANGAVVLRYSPNRFTSLDLTQVPLLKELDCSFNQLLSLDLSRLPNLSRLNCCWNPISSLDLSTSTRLTYLACNSNKLSSINFPNAPMLAKLMCRSNYLTNLDLTNFAHLKVLHCGNNRLKFLDLRDAPKLVQLECAENSLEELDIRPLELQEEYHLGLTQSDILCWEDMATIKYDSDKPRLIQRPDQNF